MPVFEPLPQRYAEARPILDRYFQENSAQAREVGGSRRRPDAPRNLIAQKGSLKCVLTWNAPADARGIVGWKVYLGTETMLFATIQNPDTRQIEIPLSANTSKFAAVAAFNAMGVESAKMPTIVQSNTDQLVVSGTGGGTGGTTPPSPPEWPSEPRGGSRREGPKL